mmetsp:Transcript_100502/g.290329  ORF Transcript_100502/g.290329 Transcript_100502/m.290329 type:complete len:264 (-) Transcript_100502:20-811(-)
MRTKEAALPPKGMEVRRRALVVAEYASAQSPGDTAVCTRKAWAGKAQEMAIRSRLCVWPRSMVSSSAAPPTNLLIHIDDASKSTAAPAPCDAGFMADVAVAAALAATFPMPAASPRWSKQNSPCFHWPLPWRSQPPATLQSTRPTGESASPAVVGAMHLPLRKCRNSRPGCISQSSRPSPDATAALQVSSCTAGPTAVRHISEGAVTPPMIITAPAPSALVASCNDRAMPHETNTMEQDKNKRGSVRAISARTLRSARWCPRM